MSVRDVVQAAAGALGESTYIEDVFSTYLYTGNSSTQTITNGIDLAGEGGLVWIKSRSQTTWHRLVTTTLGNNNDLSSNSTAGLDSNNIVNSFNSNGFTLNTGNDTNINTYTYASWTFRKAEKFFDVVTYTGNGVAGRQIPHNLGSVPGCIIIKQTDSTGYWGVYHRSLPNDGNGVESQSLLLNSTTNAGGFGMLDIHANQTSEYFQTKRGTAGDWNTNGATYVAYLFAHDAGGFGDDGNQNVISCGSYTGNGISTGPTVTLGYEPQWLLIKKSSVSGTSWTILDNMRGLSYTGNLNELLPNVSNAENSLIQSSGVFPTATGFSINTSNGVFNESSSTYIYIAIRRGPMKTPESGTEVFSANSYTSAPSSGTQVSTGFPVDMQIKRENQPSPTTKDNYAVSRLTGVSSNTTNSGSYLLTNSTQAETATGAYTRYWNNTGFQTSSNDQGNPYVYWSFGRAPGFFDVVCYTGTGVARTVSHNLGVVPEMMIVKCRNVGYSWTVYTQPTGNGNTILLNGDGSAGGSNLWNYTSPTDSVFSVGSAANINGSGNTFVAYLFATCPGVSKVGSYTGTAATQQINCGFTGGARFVLIKRTDSTGDWYVWDSARGIVAGNDPYLRLNSTAAEVTNTDYVDTYSAGFEISSTAPAAINANGGTFIFLAIA